MRKICFIPALILLLTLIAFAALAEGDVAISAKNFPDDFFREFVASEFDRDRDGVLSAAEISKVESININGSGTGDVTGIGYFTNLKELDCYNNQLTKLDLSKNTELKMLNCAYNTLNSLDLSANTKLETLHCENTGIGSLNVSTAAALKELVCSGNRLAALDVSANTNLEILNCQQNEITTLNVSANTALTELTCGLNKLKKLDVSANTALTKLSCQQNQLTVLDVSANHVLTHLNCGLNKLKSLNVSEASDLARLYCLDNQLEQLDVSANSALELLYCSGNRLTQLDVSGNAKLATLYCEYNHLACLDVSGNALLQDLRCGENQYEAATADGKIYYKDIPGFDISRANYIGGAKQGKTAFTVTDSVCIAYAYDCGNGFSATFKVNVKYLKTDISSFTIPQAKYSCTGKQIKPAVTAVAEVNGKTVKLKKNRDYIVRYENNINVGTATVIVEGKGAYKGKLTTTFKITKGNLGSLTLGKTRLAYTGQAIEPAVTVKAGSVKLTRDKDYTVTYKNNVNAGTATVTVKGKGNFKGTLTKTFTITPAKILKVKLSKTSLPYTGKARKPIPTVTTKVNGQLVTLVKGTDYTVKYENNIEAGTATVTITGKGNYTGTIVKTFTIR